MPLIEEQLLAQSHSKVAAASQVVREIHFALVSKADLTMHDEVEVLDARVLPVQAITLLDLYDVAHVNQHFEARVSQQLENRVVVTHLLQVQVLLRPSTCVHDAAVVV